MTETTTDWQLIKRHVQRHTEADAQAAFGALVRRHMDMVYSTCLRASRTGAFSSVQARLLLYCTVMTRVAVLERPCVSVT